MKYTISLILFLFIGHFSISQTFSPKEDFYQFVNKKWMDTANIPIGKSKWGAIDELYAKTGKQVEGMLYNTQYDGYPVNSAESALLKFFKSGTDIANIEKTGIKELEIITKPIYNIRKRKDIASVLNLFFKYNISGLIGVEIHPDITDTSQKALYIMPGSLGLPNKSFYEDDKKDIQEKYKAYLKSLFLLAGEKELSINDAFAIEKALVSGMLSEEEKRNPQKAFIKKSLEQLNKNYNWSDILKLDTSLFSDNIIVMDAGYFDAWETVLKQYGINQIKSYLLANALRHAAPLLGNEWVRADFNFYQKTFLGNTEQASQAEKVLGICNQFFGETIGKLYVERFFSETSKTKIEEMVANIKMAFENRIKKLDWMHDATKAKAIEKLQKMKVKIGYPDEWTNFGKLPEINISGSSFYNNCLKLAAWKMQYTLTSITKNGQSAWFMNPQDVGAGSSPILNEIIFPAGTLQPPFYDPNNDDASNYGAIGIVIGHEISHGFDDVGSQFGANGIMENWWQPDDKEHFEILKKKVVNLYNSYEPLPGQSINGMVTLGENMADIAGVAVAFDAMSRFTEQKTVNGFSNSQRFFMAYASLCREKYRDAALLHELQTNPHCPGKYRLFGSIGNLPEFHKAFGIEKGDVMFRPVEMRITVW